MGQFGLGGLLVLGHLKRLVRLALWMRAVGFTELWYIHHPESFSANKFTKIIFNLYYSKLCFLKRNFPNYIFTHCILETVFFQPVFFQTIFFQTIFFQTLFFEMYSTIHIFLNSFPLNRQCTEGSGTRWAGGTRVPRLEPE